MFNSDIINNSTDNSHKFILLFLTNTIDWLKYIKPKYKIKLDEFQFIVLLLHRIIKNIFSHKEYNKNCIIFDSL